MTDAELALLKSELDTDPEGLGLTTMDNPTAADKLNEINDAFQVSPGSLNGQELQKAVVGAEFLALSAGKQRGWLAIISAGDGQVEVDDAGIVAQVAAIWNGTATLTNLAALQTRDASRAEVLFDHSVGMMDVAEARRL